MMLKDGDERRIECELVLSYGEPDLSVGINGGWIVVGLELRGQVYELVDRAVTVGGILAPRGVSLLCFDELGTAALRREADNASERDVDR